MSSHSPAFASNCIHKFFDVGVLPEFVYEITVRNPRSSPYLVDLVALRQGRGALMAMMNMEKHVQDGGLLSRVEVFNVTLDQVDPDTNGRKEGGFLAAREIQATQGWVKGDRSDVRKEKKRKSRSDAPAPSQTSEVDLRFGTNGRSLCCSRWLVEDALSCVSGQNVLIVVPPRLPPLAALTPCMPMIRGERS